MSGYQTFADQVSKQRDALRDRLAALDYIAEANKRAESQPIRARDREQGGMVLDPVDPTRVVVPVVWLRSLLAAERQEGYGIIAGSQELRALCKATDQTRKSTDEWKRFEGAHPALAAALSEFLDIL